MTQLGFWERDGSGLPCFEYAGKLPYREKLPNGTPVKLPEDPWFLLGNYRVTMFTHVSGEYELISGQRSWARINQGNRRNSGVNSAAITINGQRIVLTGMESVSANPEKCQRVFGCGFAEYTYHLGDVDVRRNLSVRPSDNPYNGASAFLLTVTVKNTGSKCVECVYEESIHAHFEEIRLQMADPSSLPLSYHYACQEDAEEHSVSIVITATSHDPLLFPSRDTMAVYDGFPPTLFLHALDKNTVLSAADRELSAKHSLTLGPSEEATVQIIVGFSFEQEASTQRDICAALSNAGIPEKNCGAFSEAWTKIIPSFEHEQDDDLRRELRWHIYNLEAMATYSEFYEETKIPQGTCYDYDWGSHASARDNFQHALPLVYYNQPLAKSVLRYMLKRTTPFGEIRLIEYGNGHADNERYFTSDQQLFFFQLLSEYLRVTKDYSFLAETVQPYPVRNMPSVTTAELAEQCFVQLRDTIGTGVHGLVRLLNSDWNDAVYYIEKVPYNQIFFTGESHMNSAMVLSIFQTLIPQLCEAAKVLPELAERLNRLAVSMSQYRSRILAAFMADLGDRAFPRRMYFNGKPYGDDNMFLEPQGFTLQMNELPVKRKRILYAEMLQRVYAGETLGAREQQAPELDGDNGFERGSRENGGFWWALNGPVIIGVAQFDKAEAHRLLNQMTLRHLSEVFPQYWSSYWSAADQVESALIPEVGLPDQTDTYANIPVYCAHPHAWIPYCYYKINE